MARCLEEKFPFVLANSPYTFDLVQADGVTNHSYDAEESDEAVRRATELASEQSGTTKRVVALFEAYQDHTNWPPAPFARTRARITDAVIVLTTFPKLARYEEWGKQVKAGMFIMTNWSDKELKQLG